MLLKSGRLLTLQEALTEEGGFPLSSEARLHIHAIPPMTLEVQHLLSLTLPENSLPQQLAVSMCEKWVLLRSRQSFGMVRMGPILGKLGL